jgi:hypothetical protein
MYVSHLGTNLKIPSQYKLKLLHTQPFTNNQLHFLLTVQCAKMEKKVLMFPESVSKTNDMSVELCGLHFAL